MHLARQGGDLPSTPKRSKSDGNIDANMLLKRYKAVVVSLSVICVLLIVALVLVFVVMVKPEIGPIYGEVYSKAGCHNKWQTREGQGSVGGLAMASISADKCREVCEGIFDCLAVDYSPTTGLCWLHTKASNLEDKTEDELKIQFTLLGRCVEKDRHLTFFAMELSTAVLPDEGKKRFPKDCQSYYMAGAQIDGVYPINLLTKADSEIVDVYCDMTNDGGGWTTILKREDGSVKFENRNWREYKKGFGSIGGEHWIGNDIINELTLNNGDVYELRFDLMSFNDTKRFAKYTMFAVSDEFHEYRNYMGTYFGDAGNSFYGHRNMNFSTVDRDNDNSSSHCAQKYTGGWWYKGCHSVMLTGIYGSTEFANGVDWSGWLGHSVSLMYADMKIRPNPSIRGSCKSLMTAGFTTDGVYNISLHIDTPMPRFTNVYCDMTTQGGGWMLLMRRIDGSQSFSLAWDDYRNGFGDKETEFWMGLEDMHKFTSTAIDYELRIELESHDGDVRYIVYDRFMVSTEADNYRLILGDMKEGDLPDELRKNNKQPFSTRDNDNDDSDSNCAQMGGGGWWFKDCTDVLLTGLYVDVNDHLMLRWKNWLSNGQLYPSIAQALMMIRPVIDN